MKKKACCVLLTLVIVLFSIPFSTKSVNAENTGKMANLVLFVSFSDTDVNYWNNVNHTTGINTIGEDINCIYNKTSSYLAISAKDYFDIISCGKLELNNIMPQMSDEKYTIVPITLDMPTSNYRSANQDYSLISNTLEKLNQSTGILEKITESLDCNEDGLIDNVTFIVASDEVSGDSTLYPHKGELGGVGSIQGVPMNAYNVINYGRLKGGRAGVVSHELLHVLGPLDTYVNCDDSSGSCDAAPVGCWDIMATSSHRVQYPLASTRRDLGWITIEEAVTSGTYTLTTPQTDSNHYAMILKTSYSDTEYFVVEYRKQGSSHGADIKDRMDVFIGGSGIIVYRVNLAASPKSNLTQDYIYLFREGESEETATGAKAKEAYLSAESGRTGFGSSDAAATTIDGAITYTDGTNSGIVIKNVGSAAGDSITFDLEYTIDMTGKSWNSESYQSVSTSNGSEMDVAVLNGQVYRSNTRIVNYNGKLYGLCSNNKFKAELLCYENGKWRSVWVQPQDTTNAADLDLEVGSDGLYLVYGPSDYTSLKVYRMDASEKMTDITGTMAVQGRTANPKIAVTSTGVVIAYRDYQNQDVIHAYVKQGNNWQVLDTKGASGNIFQIHGSGNDVYLTTAHGNGNYLYQCDLANTRTFVKSGNEYTANTATSVDIVDDKNGIPYVIFYDADRNVVMVQAYQNNTWKQLGMNVCNHMVINLKAAVDNDKMYIAYQGESFSGVKSHSILNTGGTSQTINIQSLTLNQSQVAIQTGETVVLQAFIAPLNTTQSKKITWSSSNSGAASVDQNGKITGKSVGTAVITAKTVNGIKAVCTVTVSGKTVTPSYTNTEAFVARLYNKCLGREPETSGLHAWNEALVTGRNSGAGVGYGFVFSDEYKNKNTSNEAYVEMLYQVFLNRGSDPQGKAGWVDLLNQGVSREYVFAGFAHSEEYSNLCASYGIERGTVSLVQPRDQNPELTKFVNRLYKEALGRNGEEAGINNWCYQILTQGQSPISVAEDFIHSQEFQNKELSDEEYIKVLYRTFLGREYDQAGLDNWCEQLRQGAARDDVLHGFAYSPEFRGIMEQFGL